MNMIDIIFLTLMAAFFIHLLFVFIRKKKAPFLEIALFASGIFYSIRFLSLGAIVDAVSGTIGFLILCFALLIQIFNLDVEILGVKLRKKRNP